MVVYVCLGIFIALQFALMFFSERYDRYIRPSALDTVLLMQVALVAAFIVCDFKLTHFAGMIFDLIGYTLLLLSCFLVRALYLPKILKDEIIYQMFDFQKQIIEEDEDRRCIISGVVIEGKHAFHVYAEVEPETLDALAAKGFFDAKASKEKTLPVTLASRRGMWHKTTFYEARVVLVNSEVM